ERAVGVEVVAGTIRRVVFRRRVAGAPIGDVGVGIVGAGDIEGAAAGLPGVVLVLPGLVPKLAGAGDSVKPPLFVAGLGIERDQPIADATIAARGADEDRVLERKRRGVERKVGLVTEVLVPDDLASFLVGRDHAAVAAGHRDDEV